MGEGASSRGKKAPRTLFSLGRSGGKTPGEPADPAEEEPTEAAEGAEDLGEGKQCVSCAEVLPVHARFCAGCGTEQPEVGEPGDEEGSDHSEVDEEEYEYVEVDEDEELEGEYEYEYVEVDEDEEALPPPPSPEALEQYEEALPPPPSPEALEQYEEALPPPPSPEVLEQYEEELAIGVVAEAEALLEGTSAEFEELEHELAELADEEVPVGEAAEPEDGHDEGEQPAAVLYADPSVVEELPPPPDEGLAVAVPVMGTARDETTDLALDSEQIEELPFAPADEPIETSAEQGKKKKTGVWIAAAAAAAAIALIGGIALAGSGGGDGDDDEVVAGPRPTVRAVETTTTQDSTETSETTETTERTTTSGPSSTTTASTSTTLVTSTTSGGSVIPPPTPPPTPSPTPPVGTAVFVVSPTTISGSCSGGAGFSIRNTGTGTGQYFVQAAGASATPSSGTLTPGQSVTVVLRGSGCPRDYATSATVQPSGTTINVTFS